ncbi:MAG: cytochrome c biogenesis protein CcdA, partial [Angustibacter sp.]
MTLLLLGALLAGILTTLAPCVLPLLPVIVGGAISPGAGQQSRAALGDRKRALLIAAGLAISVLLFTLLLRASTILIDVPPEFWQIFSGVVLILLGLVQLLPALWERADTALDLGGRSHRLLGSGGAAGGVTGALLTGAALGPVFSSCSPLYGYVVATVLPSSWARGIALLLAYVLGLAGTLLIVALLGQRAVRKLRWAANPQGWFRRVIALLFILVGLAIITGFDRDIQTWLIEQG